MVQFMVQYWMRANGGVVNSIDEASKIIKKQERQTKNVIAELVDKKYIKRIGSNKKCYWEIIK